MNINYTTDKLDKDLTQLWMYDAHLSGKLHPACTDKEGAPVKTIDQ